VALYGQDLRGHCFSLEGLGDRLFVHGTVIEMNPDAHGMDPAALVAANVNIISRHY
jgi:hypothetical protein